MKKITICALLLSLFSWSCTKDMMYDSEILSEPSSTRASATSLFDEYVDKQVYITTYLDNSSKDNTYYLSLLFDNTTNSEMKAKTKFTPAVTVEPLSFSSEHPDLNRRQIWYIRKKNGQYYLESAISGLATKPNVQNMFGETAFWNYWIQGYGTAPIGAYGDKDALYLQLYPNAYLPQNYFFTFDRITTISSKEIYKIKTNTSNGTFKDYNFVYPNPNPGPGQNYGGGQVIMKKNDNTDYSRFHIYFAEEMIFDHIEYDLSQAEAGFVPDKINITYYQNTSRTEPIKGTSTWSENVTIKKSWTEDKTTTSKFSTTFNFTGLKVETPILSLNFDGGYSFTVSTETTDKTIYNDVFEQNTTIGDSKEFKIDPLQSVKLVTGALKCTASIPYTIYFKGISSGALYSRKGVWKDVNFTGKLFLMYDITNLNELKCINNESNIEFNPQKYICDETVNMTVEKEGLNYYRLYYGLANPAYPNPTFSLNIMGFMNGNNDLALHYAEGPFIDEFGSSYFRFQYPPMCTTCDLTLTAKSGTKTISNKITL